MQRQHHLQFDQPQQQQFDSQPDRQYQYEQQQRQQQQQQPAASYVVAGSTTSPQRNVPSGLYQQARYPDYGRGEGP